MKRIRTKNFNLAIYSAGDLHSKKIALVLPGKLDTKDYAHMRSHVEYMAKLGYYSVSFDPPGTWESSGDISLYTTTNYIQATHELIEYFENQPTFIMGHSRGATIATVVGTQNPYVFAYAAVMSSFAKDGFIKNSNSKWKEAGIKISMRELPPGGGVKEKRFELPYSFLEDQSRYKITDDIITCTKPKLFILGKNDLLVSPDRIREMYGIMHTPKELYESNAGHDYRKYPVFIEEINRIIGKFLQEL